MAARVLCMVSGVGSIASALVEACRDPAYGAGIVAFGADRTRLGAFAVAKEAGVPTFSHRLPDYPDRDAWDAALTASALEYEPDLVVLAGFLKLVGPRFLRAFPGKVVNTHSALLPSFPGIHGPADALEYGVKVTGATLFVVDEGTDTGPIVAQEAVPVLDDDTVDTLHERIKVVERRLVVDSVGEMMREGFRVEGRRVILGR